MCGKRGRKSKELLSGLISLAVLKILSKEPLYGYALARIISEMFDHKVEKAVIYTILRRLEEKDFVRSEWRTSDSGPARRIYFVTEEGQKFLSDKLRCLVKLMEICRRILEY